MVYRKWGGIGSREQKVPSTCSARVQGKRIWTKNRIRVELERGKLVLQEQAREKKSEMGLPYIHSGRSEEK